MEARVAGFELRELLACLLLRLEYVDDWLELVHIDRGVLEDLRGIACKAVHKHY